MPKQTIFCDECQAEFNISYKKDVGEPSVCPFCGEDLNLAWNSAEENED
jgi:hypothetical protein